jgi:hypothetical protein
MGQALQAQGEMRLAFDPLLELVDDARLPDPGHAGNADGLPFSVFGVAPALLQESKLGAPPDQWGQGGGMGSLKAAGVLPHMPDAKRAHGRCHAL